MGGAFTYNMVVTYGSRDSTVTLGTETLNIVIDLPMGVTEAEFDLDAMTWLTSGTPDYKIEYLDASGKVYAIQNSDGEIWQVDENGNQTSRLYINANASGSGDGNDSYQWNTIKTQRIAGTISVTDTEAASGEKTFTAGVKVLNAKKDTEVTPTFRLWFTGNEKNYSTMDETNDPAYGNNTYTPAENEAVKVTCAPLFDLQLVDSNKLAYNSWYNFNTRKEVTDTETLTWLTTVGSAKENWGKSDPSQYETTGLHDQDGKEITEPSLSDAKKADLSNIRYGQMRTLSLALHLENQANSSKGMKGISLPVGDVTFDLQLKSTATQTNGNLTDTDLAEYYAVLWEYDENAPLLDRTYTYEDSSTTQIYKNALDNMRRNMLWDGNGDGAVGMNAPYNWNGATNGGSVEHGFVYNGATIALTAVNGTEETTTTTSTAHNAVYSFKVSGYDFDLDSWSFPNQDHGYDNPQDRR